MLLTWLVAGKCLADHNWQGQNERLAVRAQHSPALVHLMQQVSRRRRRRRILLLELIAPARYADRNRLLVEAVRVERLINHRRAFLSG